MGSMAEDRVQLHTILDAQQEWQPCELRTELPALHGSRAVSRLSPLRGNPHLVALCVLLFKVVVRTLHRGSSRRGSTRSQ